MSARVYTWGEYKAYSEGYDEALAAGLRGVLP